MRGRVLVTGLSGFSGHYVAESLRAAGYTPCDLGGSRAGEPAPAAIDLLDAPAVSEAVASLAPEFVIHLAAVANVAHSSVEAIYRTNIVGTRNLLQALDNLDTAPRKVILASSANIYGTATEGVVTEEAPPVPQNDYAVSKYSMELMSRQFGDRFPITITRPFNYTGVGQDEAFLLPKLVSHFARGERSVALGNTDVYRDFSDVRQVAQAYTGLLADGVPGEVYNICSGREHSIADVLDMLADIAGYRIEVKVNPAFVRRNEVRRLVGSSRKLEGVLGSLRPMPLRDTLEWMYRSCALS